jgi:hypothetical protein
MLTVFTYRPLPPDGAQPCPHTSTLKLAVGTHFTQDALPLLRVDLAKIFSEAFTKPSYAMEDFGSHVWGGANHAALSRMRFPLTLDFLMLYSFSTRRRIGRSRKNRRWQWRLGHSGIYSPLLILWRTRWHGLGLMWLEICGRLGRYKIERTFNFHKFLLSYLGLQSLMHKQELIWTVLCNVDQFVTLVEFSRFRT